MSEDTGVPIPQRINAIENAIERLLEKITGVLDVIKPISGLIPGAGVIVNEVDAAGHFGEELIHIAEGGAVDPAAMAAGKISNSTGNDLLDMRLERIESTFALVMPVIAAIAKEFGYDLPTAPAPAPMPAMAASSVSDATAAGVDAVVMNAG